MQIQTHFLALGSPRESQGPVYFESWVFTSLQVSLREDREDEQSRSCETDVSSLEARYPATLGSFWRGIY